MPRPRPASAGVPAAPRTLSARTKLRKRPGIVTVEEQGTIYIIPPLHAPIRLNAAATLVWRLAVAGAPVARIAQRYGTATSSSAAESGVTVDDFLAEMIAKGLLCVRR